MYFITTEMKNKLFIFAGYLCPLNTNIDNLAGRLTTLEMNIKQAPTSGIFSYIKRKDDQKAS